MKKITKYFCGLEKRNYISKQMTKLTLNNGEEIYESNDIIIGDGDSSVVRAPDS